MPLNIVRKNETLKVCQLEHKLIIRHRRAIDTLSPAALHSSCGKRNENQSRRFIVHATWAEFRPQVVAVHMSADREAGYTFRRLECGRTEWMWHVDEIFGFVLQFESFGSKNWCEIC